MRPIIYIARDEDYRTYSRNPKLSNAIQVVSYDSIASISNQSGINMPEYVDVGSVLIEHPYIAGKYVDADKLSPIDICKSKFFKISEIACLLGAKEYTIVASQHKNEERVWNVDGSIDYRVVSANANVQNKNDFCGITNISLHDTFGNGANRVTKSAYNKAMEKIEHYNLADDEEVNSLWELRNPGNDNYLRSRTFHYDMTREVNKLLDIAFSISSITIFGLSGNVRRTLTQKETITLDIEFLFSK